MFDQVFSLSDLPKLFFLVFLEILLSIDNAIVLGLLAFKLPKNSRSKALYTGLISAFILRAAMVIALSYFIHYRWVQVLGAFYLILLSVQYFKRGKNELKDPQIKQSLWMVVFKIELFDLIFAFDSVLAAVAFIGANNPLELHSKIWIVYLGGVVGMVAVRFAAKVFTQFISKFPNMEKSAHLLIGWIGVKLVYEILFHTIIFDYVFWGVFIILFLFGFWKSRKYVK